MSAMPSCSIIQVSLSNELREQLAGLTDESGGSPGIAVRAACYIMRMAIYEFVDFVETQKLANNTYQYYIRYYGKIELFDLQYYVLYERCGRQITVRDIVFSSPNNHPPSGGGPPCTKVIVPISSTNVVGAIDATTVIDDLFDIAASARPSGAFEFAHTSQGENAMFATSSNPATILASMAGFDAMTRKPFFVTLAHDADVACTYRDAINIDSDGDRATGTAEVGMSDMPIVSSSVIATGAAICMPFFITRDSARMVGGTRLCSMIGALADEIGALGNIHSSLATIWVTTTKKVSSIEEKQMGRKQMPANRASFDVVTPLGC